MKRTILPAFVIAGAALFFCFASPVSATDVEQWFRFEQSFTSPKDYENQVLQIKLKVEFTSPDGNERTLLRFWDGDSVWRVCFSSDVPAKWTYKTNCSDQSNNGLHNQTDSLKKGMSARCYHPRTGGWLDAGKVNKSPQTLKLRTGITGYCW
jgi:hypothetical protein